MKYTNSLQEKLRLLDRQLRQNMVCLKPLHHSTGDWDFLNTNWTLDSGTYVSAPSSLKFTANGNHTLVKTTTVPIAYVKEGRIITQRRSIYWHELDPARTEIVFRYQDNNNYYCLNLFCNDYYTSRLYVYRRKNGVFTRLQQSGVILQDDQQWVNFRITWWNDYVGLVIRIEYGGPPTWTKIMDDAYDSENNWKDIGGRIGLGDFALTINASAFLFDDTYIYGIPP